MTIRNVIVFFAITSSIAFADTDADRLFKQGKSLLASGQIAAACDAFAQSDARQERVGTLLNLGDCREQNEQIATAWATFVHAAAVAQDLPNEHKRADEARRRAGYLQPRLSYLTISVPDASDVDGLAITRDGAPIDRQFWNQGVPIDGGTYVIEATAPGRDPWRTTITVAPESAHATVEVPRFQPIADLAPQVVAPAPKPHLVPKPPSLPASLPPSRWSSLRYVSLGATAVTLAGIATGTLAGLAANSAAARASSICPQSPCTDADGNAAATRAKRDATISNLSFAGAAVAAAGAVTLWILGKPSHAAVAADVGRDHADLALTLEF